MEGSLLEFFSWNVRILFLLLGTSKMILPDSTQYGCNYI